jgi:hypothetical protein
MFSAQGSEIGQAATGRVPSCDGHANTYRCRSLYTNVNNNIIRHIIITQ